MYGISEGNLITNGTSRATVKAVTTGFIVAAKDDGTEFVLNSTEAQAWSIAPVGPPSLVIERPFVVYATDGTRVDGYRFESRARRNNDERFASQGYFLGVMRPEYFEFVLPG
jgi:hypothetical protein